MRLDTLSGPCRDSARRMVDHYELEAMPLRKADAVAPPETFILDKPKIEFFKIFAGTATPEAIVSIVSNGKSMMFTANRRDVMKILREASEAVFNMEIE